MNLKDNFKNFKNFLKEDTWQSWVVSIILAFVLIKLIFFPTLSFLTGTSLPLVVVESCSMYHSISFDAWWEGNKLWYMKRDISKRMFETFPNKNGLNKGDVILLVKKENYNLGDIIVFDSKYKYPLIPRVIEEDPYGTKGDHNFGQLDSEKEIDENIIYGKTFLRIPYIGWVKLIFFEFSKSSEQRGFCK